MQGEQESIDSAAFKSFSPKLDGGFVSSKQKCRYDYYSPFHDAEKAGNEHRESRSLYVNFCESGFVRENKEFDHHDQLTVALPENNPASFYNFPYSDGIFAGYDSSLGYVDGVNEFYAVPSNIHCSAHSFPLDYEYNEEQHVNPAQLEGSFSFQLDSGQTATFDYPIPPNDLIPIGKKSKQRKQGMPTNIIPTQKMDRKTLKRLRNRVSASRCRSKKKEWIEEMENENSSLINQNRVLEIRISELEDVLRSAGLLID